MTWSVQRPFSLLDAQDSGMHPRPSPVELAQLLPNASWAPGATLVFRRKWIPKQLVWCILDFFVLKWYLQILLRGL